MPTWTQEKETILGESTEVQHPFNPRRGWSLDPNPPTGCHLKGLRTVRTADGVVHKLYRHVVLPEVMAECEALLARAADEIRRSDAETEKIQLLLAIANTKSELARLENEYAEKFSAAREATAVPKV